MKQFNIILLHTLHKGSTFISILELHHFFAPTIRVLFNKQALLHNLSIVIRRTLESIGFYTNIRMI